MFFRQWWRSTLFVAVAVGVMIRLGIWQLDRLEQRRAFNASVFEQSERSPLKLTGEVYENELVNMEYREVFVRGVYDHLQEVALRNQVWRDRPGVNLITPLLIEGSDQAVLVNRGWIPNEESSPENWGKFSKTTMVDVHGVIRKSQEQPDIGFRDDPMPKIGERLLEWNFVNISRIDDQVSYTLLPIYIQAVPDNTYPEDRSLWSRDQLPFPNSPELELTDGPHLGYAIQWFLFATILGVGYSIFIYRETKESRG